MSEQATGFWLSPQQKLAWKLTSEGLHGGSRTLCRISIHGEVDADQMRASLNQIVSRHESLRTVFRRQPGMKFPFQVVLDSQEPTWEQIDLSGKSQAERDTEIDGLLTREKQVAADGEHSTVVRAFLVQEEPARYSLVLSFSSLCADAPSLLAIFRELCAIYAGKSDLPEPFRYVQFAQWQLDLLESEEDDARKARASWEKIAAGQTPILLPLEKQAGTAFTPDLVCVELDAKSAGDVLGSSQPNLLLSAWAALVARVSQQNSLVLHVEAPGREFEELENAVGSFSRMLPVGIAVESHFSFADVCRRTSESLQEAIGVQEFLPLEAFDYEGASFSYYDLGKTEPAGGAQFGLDRVQIIAERFKLRLVVVRRGPRVELEFHYDAARLDRSVVKRIAGWYQNLLVAALKNAEAKVSDLPLLSEAERQQLVEWNNTAAEYPAEKCLHQLFEVQAERTPERVAVRCGELAFTYQQLNARANQLAHYLRRQGVGPDKLVGLCLERSVETMVAVLGILKAGGAYLPLNPDNPPARLRQQMEGAVVILTESKLAPQVPEFPGAKLVLDAEPTPWAGEPTSNPSCTTTPENLVYVLYTSGSTGVPKGVAVRHRNLVNYADFIGKRLEAGKHSEGLQFATVSTLGADLGNTCIYPSLISGGTLHVIGYETATDGMRFAEYATKYGIDVLKIVPSHLSALLQTQSDAEQAKKLLPRKYLVFGGETLTEKLLEKIEALPSTCEVLNHYGPTETTVGSLTLTLKGYDFKSNQLSSIPIGRPIQNTQVYVLDQNLKPVPVGVRGELYIAGAGVTAGYLNQPEKTSERFLRNPFSSDGTAKMYRTRDLARYLEGGEIEFLGRGDDQVKVRGFRIELGEIEAALARHAGVKQALVLARDDEQGDKRLLGYAVVQGSDVTGDELRDYLKQEVPNYMVPQAIAVLGKFPLTPNGKIDRQALPEPQAVAQRASITAPRDEAEAALLSIWRKVLHSEAVGVTDNFFDVGGHSLLAVQLMASIAKETGHEVPLTALFRAPTVESMAKLLRDANQPKSDPIVMPVQAGEGVPFFVVASPSASALGYAALAKAMGADQAVYKLQSRGRVVPPHSPIPLTDMRSLALEYIAGMRSVQPSGPYYLGGMCAGAHIAEQIILELEAQGETVGLFAVFDTWVLQNAYVRWLWRIHYYQKRTRQLLRSGGRRPLTSVTGSLRRTLNRIIHPFARQPQTPWQKVYWPGKNFTNPHFNAPVAVFKRPRQPFYYVKDTTLGWGSRSRGGVEIHCIEMPHLMLRPPHVRKLGSLLRESLSRATSNGPHRDMVWRILDDKVARPKTIDVQT